MEVFTLAARDWFGTFRPAVLALLNGQPVYIFNPPWALAPLIPFALVPWGRELLALAAFFALAFTAVRLKATPLGLAAFLLAPFTLNALVFGNIEWLALLGLVFPPRLGLVFLALKPQMTWAVMAFYAVAAYRAGGWRSTASMLAPLAVLTLVSFAAFGLWPLEALGYLRFQDTTMNYSFFPASVPLGLALFVQSLRTREVRYALAASPLGMPVLTSQCWLVVVLALAPATLWSLIAAGSLWAYVVYVRWAASR